MKKLAVQLGFGFRLTKRRGELWEFRYQRLVLIALRGSPRMPIGSVGDQMLTVLATSGAMSERYAHGLFLDVLRYARQFLDEKVECCSTLWWRLIGAEARSEAPRIPAGPAAAAHSPG